tara:strand:+ start:237 stop:599 length:363 start_codon:yes stop_codon:yes gene_type:complete
MEQSQAKEPIEWPPLRDLDTSKVWSCPYKFKPEHHQLIEREATKRHLSQSAWLSLLVHELAEHGDLKDVPNSDNAGTTSERYRLTPCARDKMRTLSERLKQTQIAILRHMLDLAIERIEA